MKQILKVFIVLLISLQACNEDILDKNPADRYSDPIVWSDINLAQSYLGPLYSNVEWGFNQRGNGYQTDLFACELVQTKGGEVITYNSGQITPDKTGDKRGHANWYGYNQVQQLNLFLANIDRVPEAYSDSEKTSISSRVDVLKGEALFLRALIYHDLVRNYGGVPIFDKPNEFNSDFSGVERASFEETINFIVKDLDEASLLLKKKSEMEMGRATKEAALAVKSRILLFAASDLTADGTAENELVGYSNPNRKALWTAARDAAKALIDLGTCELSDFGAPDQDAVSRKCFDFFKAYTLSDNEVIWGRMIRPDVGYAINTNQRNGPNGNNNHGNNGPTANIVDSYEMSDGSKFSDHFVVNENNEYVNISSKYTDNNIYKNRDPRLYASIFHDGAVWQPRFSNLQDLDPIGIYDRRTRIVIKNGEIVSKRPGIDTRQGPVESWNGGYSGYLLKKFMDDAIIGRDERNENINIYIRYAEVILNYAEACFELGDEETAKTYINMVRNRAGMPNFAGDLTQALRQERRIEFLAENLRWYDVRRWKILKEVLDQQVYGVDITEVTEDGVVTTTWKRIIAQPDNNFSKKLYWIPLPTEEINKAPQLIQNPGYNL